MPLILRKCLHFEGFSAFLWPKHFGDTAKKLKEEEQSLNTKKRENKAGFLPKNVIFAYLCAHYEH